MLNLLSKTRERISGGEGGGYDRGSCPKAIMSSPQLKGAAITRWCSQPHDFQKKKKYRKGFGLRSKALLVREAADAEEHGEYALGAQSFSQKKLKTWGKTGFEKEGVKRKGGNLGRRGAGRRLNARSSAKKGNSTVDSEREIGLPKFSNEKKG